MKLNIVQLVAFFALHVTFIPISHAGLVLNLLGQNLGLRLSVFASDFPHGPIPTRFGAMGATSTAEGKILVSDHLGNIYRFDDRDDQTIADALSIVSLGSANSGGALAQTTGQVYLSASRQILRLNNDGTVNFIMLGGALVGGIALATNPISGHLYTNNNISAGSNLTDINPFTNTFVIGNIAGGRLGGVSLDGAVLYNSAYPRVQAQFTGHLDIQWISDAFAGALNVIQAGALVGDIVGYDQTTGQLRLFNHILGTSVVVGIGDLSDPAAVIGIDHLTGSLLFADGETVYRISSAAEPADLALLILSGVALVWRRHVNRKISISR